MKAIIVGAAICSLVLPACRFAQTPQTPTLPAVEYAACSVATEQVVVSVLSDLETWKEVHPDAWILTITNLSDHLYLISFCRRAIKHDA